MREINPIHREQLFFLSLLLFARIFSRPVPQKQRKNESGGKKNFFFILTIFHLGSSRPAPVKNHIGILLPVETKFCPDNIHCSLLFFFFFCQTQKKSDKERERERWNKNLL